MAGIVKPLIRIGVIGALAAGTVVVIAGPGRVHAWAHQARHAINDKIDRQIDDPIALRAQLRDLESQYPQRIGEVRADLTELNEQIAHLEQELAVSQRVVALADQDLGQMETLLSQAENVRAENPYSIVRVRLGSASMDLDETYAKRSQVSEVRSVYADRCAEIERDMGYLSQQQSRLGELLGELETERAEFQRQLWQLDRQVDAIARNERMIELMEKRHASVEETSRYRADSLDQVTSRLGQIKAEQESRLAAIANRSVDESYETRARRAIEGQPAPSDLVPLGRRIEVAPPVIEIDPDQDDATSRGPVASRTN